MTPQTSRELVELILSKYLHIPRERVIPESVALVNLYVKVKEAEVLHKEVKWWFAPHRGCTEITEVCGWMHERVVTSESSLTAALAELEKLK